MIRTIKPEDCIGDFVLYFRDNSIVPLVGSGISCGALTKTGEVPNGEQFMNHMRATIRSSQALDKEDDDKLNNMSFSALSDLYDDDDIVDENKRRDFLFQNFYQAKYAENDYRRSFFDIGWPYIYSLNIDDVIERSTDYTVILPNREFNPDVFEKDRCLLKLHGDIKDIIAYKDGCKVFNSREYVASLFENRPMLDKLATDYDNLNMVFLGCSLLDEIDLLALEPLRKLKTRGEDYHTMNNADFYGKKNYLFTYREPSKFEISKYKHIGITDIVVFDKPRDMYEMLKNAWDESLKEQSDFLEDYSDYKLIELDYQDPNNRELFFYAVNTIDHKENSIIYPYYYIRRELTTQILSRISEHRIQIITGSRFSGKTYVLTDIFKSDNLYKKYLFDTRIKLTDKNIVDLLKRKKCIMLFDAGVLSRGQFEMLISHHELISENESSVVLFVHSNDSETLGIIRMLEDNNQLSRNDYYLYQDGLKNGFTRTETDDINSKLPATRLTPYRYDDTIINHLMSSAGEARTTSRFSDIHIPSDGVREVALSIALASNEVLFYSDIVTLELEEVMVKAVKECEPLIEQLKTSKAERSPRDMSGKKYILNSKYWIRSELINLVNGGYVDIIKEGYRYLIEKLIDSSENNMSRRREKYRKIIYFDTINDIFGGKKGGRRDLVAQIYSALSDLLGTDYQYNHQRAKCLMRDAYYQRQDSVKERSYTDARDSALIARRQVENEYANHANDKLLISLAHIEYTLASILASICDLHSYSDISEIEEAVEVCYSAAINPYNADEFEKEKRRTAQYGIINFTKSLPNNEVVLKTSNLCQRQYSELARRFLVRV